jgi:hypothetical protein
MTDPARLGKSRLKEVPDPLEKATILLIRIQKVLPGFQNPPGEGEIPVNRTAIGTGFAIKSRSGKALPTAIAAIPSTRDPEIHPAFQNLRAQSAMAIVPVVTVIAIKNHLERARILLSTHDPRVYLVFQKSPVPERIPIPIAPMVGVIADKDHSGKQNKNRSFNPG